MSLRPAVAQSLSQQDVPTEDAERLRHAVNKEIRPVLQQARKSLNALNAEPISPAVTTDGAGTYAVLWTSGEMPQDGKWAIHSHVEGDSATVYAGYKVHQYFRSLAGTITAVSPLAVDSMVESAAACDVRFSIDSTNRVITLDARDDAAAAMTWQGSVYTPGELTRE